MKIFMSVDFSKSCCRRLTACILSVGGMSIFGRERGGLCVYVNEEGFCQDIA